MNCYTMITSTKSKINRAGLGLRQWTVMLGLKTSGETGLGKFPDIGGTQGLSYGYGIAW